VRPPDAAKRGHYQRSRYSSSRPSPWWRGTTLSAREYGVTAEEWTLSQAAEAEITLKESAAAPYIQGEIDPKSMA